LPAHSLPSTHSLGGPISARLTPPDGVTFEGVMAGDPESIYLLSPDASYGFMVKLEDVYTKNRNGKAIISIPKGAKVLTPTRVNDIKNDWVAAVTSIGRMLMFPISELTLLPKGKSLKIIQILPAKLKTGEEYVVAMTAMGETDKLVIYAGKKHMTMKSADQEYYIGERGRRGNMLGRNYRKVIRIKAEGTG
jgi:topoisomerase IV subunit A